MARDWNLFMISRRQGDEDQLTEMLAWLASSVPEVRTALVEMGLDLSLDAEDITVRTQYGVADVGRLDALLEGPGVRLVVESKLASGYGPDQVGRYLRWLASDGSSAQTSGLMTLTARRDPLPGGDVEYAVQRNLIATARRWEEFHAVLEPLTAGDGSALAAQMVQEFLEMLSDKGLVPVRPLSEAELGTAWADAWVLVSRYHDFFQSCTTAISVDSARIPSRGRPRAETSSGRTTATRTGHEWPWVCSAPTSGRESRCATASRSSGRAQRPTTSTPKPGRARAAR
jgi:hypothetical protein